MKAKAKRKKQMKWLVTKNVTLQMEITTSSAGRALDTAIDSPEPTWEYADSFYTTECLDSDCGRQDCDVCRIAK